MSNQDNQPPGGGLSLIPTNALTTHTLNSLQALMRAVSADGVSPLAVNQVEVLGACFHLNGGFASKVPEWLSRFKSHRLDRVGVSIGWNKNDTASLMAQTAGGRAASVLSLLTTEMFDEENVGTLLYDLSSKLLPAELHQSSRAHMGQVAATLSKKLIGPFGFDRHLARQVREIQKWYVTSNKDVPRHLLSIPTVTDTVNFLYCLSRALRDEHSMLYFEGCGGVGYIVAIAL